MRSSCGRCVWEWWGGEREEKVSLSLSLSREGAASRDERRHFLLIYYSLCCAET